MFKKFCQIVFALAVLVGICWFSLYAFSTVDASHVVARTEKNKVENDRLNAHIEATEDKIDSAIIMIENSKKALYEDQSEASASLDAAIVLLKSDVVVNDEEEAEETE